MRRAVVAMAAIGALTACGSATSATSSSTPASGSSSPATGSSTGAPANALLAKPIVSVAPFKLVVGVGRSAVIPGTTSAILAGGLVLGDTTTDAVQKIDFGAGTVTRLPSLSVPVHDTAGSALPSIPPLVIGGGNSSEQSVVQGLVNGAWRVVGHLPTTRSDLSTVSSAAGGGRVWVFGGYDGSTPAVATVLAGTGDGTSWKSVGSLAVALRYAAAVQAADGKIYLFGGEVSSAEKDTVQTWDPQTGKGAVLTHLPMALGHMSAAVVGDKILVLGGRTDASSGAMTDRMWWFDPATRAFTDAGRLPYPVADASVAVSGNTVYLLGGESPHPITTILKIQVTQ